MECSRKLGRLEDAIDAYKNALSLMPNYAEAYNNMGITFMNRESWKAIEAYNNALLLKPDNVEAFKNIGIALRLVELLHRIQNFKNQLDYYLIKRNLSTKGNSQGCNQSSKV